jgi:ubiquinone/menaquinone biosynthesis C-methylase UbiE
MVPSANIALVNDMPEGKGKTKKVYFEVWERTGVTEHMGGVEATKDLARMSSVAPGQLIIDIGCGTGYMAAYLAGHFDVKVVCVDITAGLLPIARERIRLEGLSGRVSFVRADAHDLPFRAGTFDRAIAESVLVFCDKGKVSKEAFRILKAGGIFGDNELTLIKPPPAELVEMLSSDKGLGMKPLTEKEWLETYKNAGFRPAGARVRKVNYLMQVIDHLRIDGVINYFTSAIRGVSDAHLREVFFNKYMQKAARKFYSYVEFGLYTSEKPGVAGAKER